MGSRQLRQYYDPVTLVVADDLGPAVEPWLRHRRRLLASLEDLTDEQWRGGTRCVDWDVHGVISHLVNVDGFWVLSLSAAQAGQAPTKYLTGFDPSSSTDGLVDAMRGLSPSELLEQFRTGTDALVAVVESFTPDDWRAVGESPLGHIPARFLLGHALWDSWLHERDIFEPLGMSPPVEADELFIATWFTLFFSGLQGGLLDDAAAVGPGPAVPIDVTLAFEELAEAALTLHIDSGIQLGRANGAVPVPAGSAVNLVECMTGRRPLELLNPALPADVVAQLERAASVL